MDATVWEAAARLSTTPSSSPPTKCSTISKDESRSYCSVMEKTAAARSLLERAIESAQRANVIVYTIYYQGQNNFGRPDGGHRGGMGYPGGGYPGGHGGGWPGGEGGGGRRGSEEPRVDGKKIMERIARETGGRMFEAKKDDSIQQAYTEIQDELRHQYSLGYTPDKWQSGYHKLEVTTKKKDTKIQAREGYYAGE